jgi:hypothetical protein
VPKTAGMSMTELLKTCLSGRVFITEPGARKVLENVVYLSGKRHETLCDAESFFIYLNKSIFDFKKVFCVMRNPYDLELSRYSYLRLGHAHDKGPAQEIALSSDFKGYLANAPFFGMNPPRFNLYFTFNGVLPDNLIVLRYETLAQDIDRYMSPYLKPGGKLPSINKSRHKSYSKVYDKEAEELCFLRHRWFFEKGFYSRETFRG